MNRFIGTKTKILPELYNEICKASDDENRTVCDIFSGSLAVSLYLKKKGFSIMANDINDLSYAYSRAYLKQSSIPRYNVSEMLDIITLRDRSRVDQLATQILNEQKEVFNRENSYGEFKSWEEYSSRMFPTAQVIAYLQYFDNKIGDKDSDRSDILTHYTLWGEKSSYVSLRGRKGKRNFFDKHNAEKLDRALNHIRYWFQRRIINEFHRCTLVSILLDTMERYVNIQGTYHDFPRRGFEARAKKPLRFLFPNYFGLLHAKKKHIIGKCLDSLYFIDRVPYHDVLYIDPPYNFRQYTSYYFLPNFMARHSTISDLDNYMSKIKYVRGQNMEHDYLSSFSVRDKFLSSLKRLIEKACCNYVILSYFDGVNHWNKFLQDDNSTGFKLLKNVFENNNLFRKRSLRIVPIERLNYQSQNGHKAKTIKEYLFISRKRDNGARL